MTIYLLPNKEDERIAALASYHILDTLSEKEYDDLTALASVICNTPIALITLVDKQRQWFKSAHGVNVKETPRTLSFCSHAIESSDDIMEVEDAHADNRFCNNPLVTDEPNITFYAGVPLVNEEGHALGTLCVIDSVKKKLSNQQRLALKILARQVMDKLELRRKAQVNELLLNEVKDSYQRNITLLEQAPVAVILFRGANFIVESCNAQMLQLLGKDSTIIGKPILEALPELYGQEPYRLLTTVLHSGTTLNGYDQPVTINRNGVNDIGYYNFTYSPLIENGVVVGVIDMAIDVTQQVKDKKLTETLYADLADRNAQLLSANEEITASNEQLKASQEQLSESEEKFRLMADNISQLAWMANADGKVYWYNKRWYDYTGLNLHEMQLNGWTSVHHPKYEKETSEKIKHNFNAGKKWELTYPIKNKNGKYHWFLSSAVPTRDAQGNVSNWFGTCTEITDQIRAQKRLMAAQNELKASFLKLAETEHKQKIAILQAKLGTFNIDAQTREMTTSSRLKEIFGYEANEPLTYETSIAQISPEYKDHVIHSVERVLKEGGDYNIEFSIIKRNDGRKRWLKSTGKLYTSEVDHSGHFSGTIMDITEEKEDDLRKNDFIAMVSHELKTPLTSLNGFIQIMELHAKRAANTTSLDIIGKAKKQIKKMTTMINGFLNVARLESGKIHIELERFDMKDLIKEMEEETVSANTTHNIIFDPVLTTWVNGDRDKIGQVITNFISNALKYSAPGTNIQIACMTVDGCSTVSVRDEGLGIAQKDIPHLFERFYRVEGNEIKIAGFGIGLYLCAEIIERHQGKIWVESEPNVGSTFYFSIPVSL